MRKRLKRIALYTGLALVLLLVVGVILVRVMLTGPRVKHLIEKSLEKRLNREVTIEKVDLKVLERLKITGLTVRGREGFADKPLLTVKEVDIEADVRSLIKSWFGRLTTSVTIKEPVVFLECRADGVLNVDDLLGAESGGGKTAVKKGGARKPGKKAAAGPLLGPVEMLNLNISVENGSVHFADRANGTGTTIRELGVGIDVIDLDVPSLKGSFGYKLSAVVGAPDKPGVVEAKGKVDFDLQERDGFLGLGVEELSGTLIDLDVEGFNPSLLARLLGLPPPADSVTLTLHADILPGEQVVISGDVDIPQLDAVSLGLNDRAVPGLGLKASIEGKADLAGGNAELKIEVTCPLWKQLSLSLEVSELAAFALASGGGMGAGNVKLDIRASADMGVLTDGEVGRLLGAKDKVEGMLNLAVVAEGPVSNLAVKTNIVLEPLLVLSSEGFIGFDPVTLSLRNVSFSNAVVEYAAFPNMRLGVSGGVGFDNHSVQINNLAVTLVHKKTKQETRLVIQKGALVSGIEGAGLLADTSKITGSFVVSSPDVRVDRIVAAMEAKPPAKKKPSASKGKKSAGSAKSRKPAVPDVSFDFLSGYRLDVEIRAKKAGYDTCVLTDLAATVSLHNNIFKISGLKAGAYGGEVTGEVSADLNKPNPVHQGKFVIKNVNLNDACSRMWSYKDVFHGIAGGQIKWSASGLSPQTLKALKGGAGFRIEKPVVRNIGRFPLLDGAAGNLGNLFFPGLLEKIKASEFKFGPVQLDSTLTMDGKQPVLKIKKMKVKTVDKDYIEVQFVGGLKLSPNARDEYEFFQPTRIYFMRFPENWLAHMRLMGMFSKGVRERVSDDDLRKSIRKAAAKENLFMKIKGSVRNPKVSKMDFLDEIIKEFMEREAKNAVKDFLLKNLIKGVDKKKKKESDAGDLIKGIFDMLK